MSKNDNCNLDDLKKRLKEPEMASAEHSVDRRQQHI